MMDYTKDAEKVMRVVKMNAVLIIWDKEIKGGELTDKERILRTYTITGQDRETVLATAQTILFEEFEELAKIRGDKEHSDLFYQIISITRWRFLERFDRGVEPVVPKPEWKEFSWDIVPTQIVEAKRGEAK